MRYFSLPLLLVVLTVPAAWGVETKPIAVGEWSEWTNGLRGRLLVSEGRIAHPDGKTRETLVFVELENKVGSERLFDVYFDPDNLKCDLHDAGGDKLPEHQITDRDRKRNERHRPANCWITLPDASHVRLRVNPYCSGRPKDVGLFIPLCDTAWLTTVRLTAPENRPNTITTMPYRRK